jgi:hypothetical protein
VVRVFVLDDPSHWREVEFNAPPFPQRPLSDEPFRLDLRAAVAVGGTVHVCATVGNQSRRYVVGSDLKGAVAGSDCGFLAGGEQLLMALRGVAQLLVLDDRSGRVLRHLPLAGVPAELAH